MKTNRRFAAFLTALTTSTLPAAGLIWDDAGPTNNWSTAPGDTNWIGGVTWSNASAADFNASGSDTITLTTAAMTAGTVTFGASSAYVIDSGANNMTWSALAGAGGFTKAGSGTITIGGAGGASGTITVNAGTLDTTNSSALGTSSVTLNGGTLKTNVNLANAILLNNVAGNTISANGNYRSISGQITGSGGLIIGNGGGTPGLKLTNPANNFSGNLTTSSGVFLQVDTSEVIPDTAVVIANGAAFKVNNTIETIAGLQGSALLYSENSSRLVINSPAATTNTFTGAINAFGGGTALAITKKGDGIQIMSGGSVHSGGTLVSGGTLIARNSGVFGSGAITVNDTSTGSSNTSLLLEGAGISTARNITVTDNGSGTVTLGTTGTSSGNMTFSGVLTLNKATTLTSATADRTTYTGRITGSVGALTIAGGQRTVFDSANGLNDFTGDLTITGTNTVLQTGTGGLTGEVIPNGSNVTVGAGALLKLANLANSTETINGLNGGGVVRRHEGVSGVANLVVGSSGGGGTFSGALENGAGSLTLTKIGAGTQILSGTNLHSGATNINAGTLSLGSTGSIANSSVITVASGASFDVSGLAGGFTVGAGKALRGEGTVTGNVADDPAGVGAITGGNGISGTLTISGNLVLNGAADINIGTLSNYTSTAAIAVAGDLTTTGVSGDVFINLPSVPVGPGTYRLISHGNVLPDLSGFTLNTQPSLSARQVGNLVNNPGSLDYVVSGVNPVWTGALGSTWTTDTLTAPKNWTLPGGGATDYIEGDVVFFNDEATGSTTVDLAMDVNPVSAEFSNSAKNYTLQSTGGFGITGAATLFKAGTGILTISNANTFTGVTTLLAGTTRIGNDSSLGSGGLTLNGGTLSSDSSSARTLANASFTIGGDLTLGDAVNSGAITFSAPVNLGGATRTLTTDSAVTLAGAITNGSLAKAGSAPLTLTGSNSFGTTSIGAGVLNIGDGGTSGNLGTGNISNQGALAINRSGTLSIPGVISGTGSLEINGGGTVTLTGLNTYTGTTTIHPGSNLVLSMGINYAESHVGSAVTIGSGSTLLLTVPHATGFAYSLAGNKVAADITINAGGTVNRNGNDTYIQGLTMTGNSVVTGGGGLRLCANVTATSDATGAPTINNMALVGGSYTNAGNTHTLTVVHGPGSVATSDLTIGPIDQVSQAGATNIIKEGNGTLTLTGASIFTGTTTVNTGTLELNGTLTSATTVKTTATLKGSGSSSSTLSVESGGTVAPGNSIGTLGAGATTLAGTYVCEVDASTSDVLAVNGALNLTGSTLELSGTPAAASYTIATYTGALTGTFTASPALPSGYSVDYSTPGVIKLVATAGFTSWIDGFTFAPGADKTPSGDPDGDGVSNLVEYALAGFNPTLPDGATGTFNGTLLSFTKRSEAAADGKISYIIQESNDLGVTDVWAEVGSYATNNATTISFTLPSGLPKIFARLVVTQQP
jgi:fibronectin-binding autotransporter adhesin